ncbi:pro-neuregulin-1, membrane-bound isoform isoform X2 [Bufo gargarizans]|uniref:pro-neuregulin-1, membrane-bound isoform isoform X2 n=1 Tax=Bufo gargarizans TaxID=30331 RepID=UPI001CF319BC|nr:pro-neuregulin-1, membrane-bound isoform isoform X2 [Bufo gargarizans]
MPGDTAEGFQNQCSEQSSDPPSTELQDEGSVPETPAEDGTTQGIAGLAITCCVCLEADRLRICLNSEKICILPILACLISLCLCIAGLKWVFVDKIFEYDSPTHLDPDRINQDPIIYADSAPSTLAPSSIYTLPFVVPTTETKVTVESETSVLLTESTFKPLPTDSNLPRDTSVEKLYQPSTVNNLGTTESSTVITSKKGKTSASPTGHLSRCAEKEKTFCVNGGECYVINGITSSTAKKFMCKCPNEYTGDRCQHYVMASFYKAEELYQKRVLTITGICIALLVVGIMCVVAYCKTKKQRKKLHDRLRQSLRSERNNMVNMANGPHHPNPPPENVQLVNQYVSKNVISSEHVIERETETSFSTSHYTSTTHHSTTVTQTPSHSWSNGQSESIISESHSVIVTSSVENSRHTSPTGPRGRLNGIGGPRECSYLRHARDTPDSYRDSPHSERYVSAMTTPARMSPVDFQTPLSPKSPCLEMSPPVSSLAVSVPSVAVSPFIEEERPLLLVSPPRLRDKRYDLYYHHHHYNQQYNSYHHNPAHDSSSLPPSPLRIVEDEEYETTQEYEPSMEPVKKLVNSRRAKRTKPNGHISNRLELDTDTSSESSTSESETEDERIGEDTPFLSIQNPLATSLDSASSYRLADSRTNPTSRFSTQEELQARLSSVIANQDPIAV